MTAAEVDEEASSLCTSLDAMQVQQDVNIQLDHAPGGQDSTNDNKRSLLDLPAELWSKIGKFAIENEPRYLMADNEEFNLAPSVPREQPAIARACRALGNELLPYYYQKRILLSFTGPYPPPSVELMDRVGKFLRSVSAANRKYIAGLYWDMHAWDPSNHEFAVTALLSWRVLFTMPLHPANEVQPVRYGELDDGTKYEKEPLKLYNIVFM